MTQYRYITKLSDKAPASLVIWCLVLALLLAQMLGLMHGTLHGSGVHAVNKATLAVVTGSTRVDAQHSALHAEGKGLLASLFSSHNSEADCRLYDQASHGSAALHVASLALPVVLPSFAVAIFEGEALARWAALFDARGPPLTS